MIAEKRANDLLVEVGINNLPVDPLGLATSLGVEVKEFSLGDVCEGFLMVQNHTALIGINSDIRSERRRAFTISHEIGHLCLDVTGEANQKIECKTSGIEAYSRGLPEIEVRANKFASELLLPKRLVSDLVLNSELAWASIDKISDLANVSRTATARKFVQFTGEACALVVSENGVIKWFAPSPSFGLRVDMDSRFLYAGGPADLAFKQRQIPNEFVEVPASAWVQANMTKIKNGNLQEWSLPLNQYGQVLTLLWDDLGLGDLDEQLVASSEEDEEPFDPRYGWETPTFNKKRR